MEGAGGDQHDFGCDGGLAKVNDCPSLSTTIARPRCN
jgi:hypothetical protein